MLTMLSRASTPFTTLNFKVIEPVRMPAPHQLVQAGGRVGQEERQAPALVLLYVLPLMSAQFGEHPPAAAENHVTQSYGTKSEMRLSFRP